MKKDTGKEKIGIIGGTGLENIAGIKYSGEQFVETPYGSPSDKFRVYENDSFIIYALNRHGANHEYAPHNVNYQANIYGLYSLEVSEILSFSSVGGINLNYKNGDLVLTTDAIDNTNRGSITFYNEKGNVVHIDMSSPFCNSVREKLLKSAENAGISLTNGGIYICTDGPRFETPAEIKMYRIWGADMVGMTLFPEITLAKELGICYGNISLITNAASGVEENRKLTSDEVVDEAKKNTAKITKIIEEYIKNSKRQPCSCKEILKGAAVGK